MTTLGTHLHSSTIPTHTTHAIHNTILATCTHHTISYLIPCSCNPLLYHLPNLNNPHAWPAFFQTNSITILYYPRHGPTENKILSTNTNIALTPTLIPTPGIQIHTPIKSLSSFSINLSIIFSLLYLCLSCPHIHIYTHTRYTTTASSLTHTEPRHKHISTPPSRYTYLLALYTHAIYELHPHIVGLTYAHTVFSKDEGRRGNDTGGEGDYASERA